MDSQILEIGTGSGAITTFLASIVKPKGDIHSYDINHDTISIASRIFRQGRYVRICDPKRS